LTEKTRLKEKGQKRWRIEVRGKGIKDKAKKNCLTQSAQGTQRKKQKQEER
jgi:hypothetical protein